MTAPNKLSSALALAARGFRVFPLAAGTKVPLKGFTDFAKNATTDKDKIHQWFAGADHNIGISTEDMLVVDVDVKNPEKNGLETLQHLARIGKVLPPTTCQITATGGLHYIFKTPHPVSNTASKIGTGIDTRGNGGYILGAGSTLNGKAYRMDTSSLNTAPNWILEMCAARPLEKPQAHIKVPGIDEEKAKKRGSWYLSNLPPTTEGNRNAAGYAVAAQLKDFGLNLEDSFLIMMDEWKCEPALELEELKAVVTSAYKYGKDPQGSAAPEAMFANPEEAETDGKHPFEILNEEYAFVATGGSHRIIHETTNEEGEFTTIHLGEDTFHKKLAARKFQVDGNSKPLTKAWMGSPMRRSYDGVVFAPGIDIDKRYYNLWRGFSVTPLAPNEDPTEGMVEAVRKFEEHLFTNICGSDIEHYNWVYGWFAHIIQKPWEKPGVALVMRGRKGVGKNILLDTVGNLFRSNYMVTAHKRHILSNFNSHMEKLLLLVLDEAFWSGSKEEGGILKNLITEPTLEIERKGVDSYKMKSRLRTAIVGNEDWVIPASEDERRYAVFNVGESRMQDTVFFTALREGMEAGGNRYLFTKLLAFDLLSFDIRKAPETDALVEQKENSLDSFNKWWLDSITQGYIDDISFDGRCIWETLVDKKILLRAYLDHNKSKKTTSWILSDRKLVQALTGIAPSIRIVRAEGIADMVRLPSLKECRDLWDKKMKTKSVWD